VSLINSRQRYFRCAPPRVPHEKIPKNYYFRVPNSFKFIIIQNILNLILFLNLFIIWYLVLRIYLCETQDREALLLTYGRFFAEFLNEKSLVPLRLLASSTCVGLRYGSYAVKLRSFSRKALQSNYFGQNQNFCRNENFAIKGSCPDFP